MREPSHLTFAEQPTPSHLADEIRSRGHWRIYLQPTPPAGDRLPHRDLQPTLASARVQLRGWDFPHLDRAGTVRRRSASILGETDWRYYREVWEFWQTGLFTYLIGIHEDWGERAPGWGPSPEVATRGALLGVGDTIARMTEIFVFAARLARSPAGAERMSIAIEISPLDGRSLWIDSPRRVQLDGVFASDAKAFAYTGEVERNALETHCLSLAVDQSLEVFARFGWQASRVNVEREQSELRNLDASLAR
jgi:hypothetical protein